MSVFGDLKRAVNTYGKTTAFGFFAIVEFLKGTTNTDENTGYIRSDSQKVAVDTDEKNGGVWFSYVLGLWFEGVRRIPTENQRRLVFYVFFSENSKGAVNTDR